MLLLTLASLTLCQNTQTTRLYRAETILVESPAIEVIEFENIHRFIANIYSDPWFRGRYRNPIMPRIERGKYGNNGYSTGNTVGFPPKTTNSNILHEIAHQLTPHDSDHGPAFARVYLDLVTHYMGQEAANSLQKSFHNNQVLFR